MRRNGFSEARDPILKPLDTIECRDAIITPDGTEPDWPDADVVIGNPPFLGDKRLISKLGEDYVSRIRATYAGRVPAGADLVCYWFENAAQRVTEGAVARAGPSRNELHPRWKEPCRTRQDRPEGYDLRRLGR